MQIKNKITALTLASASMAAYAPSEPWSTLTPTATYKDAITDYNTTFGIAVMPISSSNAKRDVISQIGDGQIQATTSTVSSISSKAKTTSKTTTAAAVISQITDGQIQATITTTSKSESTVTAVSQITDGQVQATTVTTTSSTSTSSATSTSSTDSSDPVDTVSCKTDGTLQLTLNKGILTDEKGRIGSIVANRQFQFDGPPPQAGAIYAAGWSITPDGYLALGDSDIFYQCLSGNFYNLYDESIGGQCNEIHLEVVDLVSC